jgi:hypothetical protein
LARQSGSNTELIIRANNRRGSGKTGTLNFDLVMRALEGLVLAFLVIRIVSIKARTSIYSLQVDENHLVMALKKEGSLLKFKGFIYQC